MMAKYRLILFVTGTTRKSELARQLLQDFCDTYLKGDCQIAMIDVLERPDLAEEYRILATPTLIRQAPLPVRRIIGDLTDRARLIEALELTHLAAKDSQSKGNDTHAPN